MRSSPPTEDNRPAESSLGALQMSWVGNKDVLERINTCIAGMVEFANQRGRCNMDAAMRLTQAKSPNEFMLIYIQWIRDMVEDYAGHAGRLTQVAPAPDSLKTTPRDESSPPDNFRERQTSFSALERGPAVPLDVTAPRQGQGNLRRCGGI